MLHASNFNFFLVCCERQVGFFYLTEFHKCDLESSLHYPFVHKPSSFFHHLLFDKFDITNHSGFLICVTQLLVSLFNFFEGFPCVFHVTQFVWVDFSRKFTIPRYIQLQYNSSNLVSSPVLNILISRINIQLKHDIWIQILELIVRSSESFDLVSAAAKVLIRVLLVVNNFVLGNFRS